MDPVLMSTPEGREFLALLCDHDLLALLRLQLADARRLIAELDSLVSDLDELLAD